MTSNIPWTPPIHHYHRQRICFNCWKLTTHDAVACPEEYRSVYKRELLRRKFDQPTLKEVPRWKKILMQEYGITWKTTDAYLEARINEEKMMHEDYKNSSGGEEEKILLETIEEEDDEVGEGGVRIEEDVNYVPMAEPKNPQIPSQERHLQNKDFTTENVKPPTPPSFQRPQSPPYNLPQQDTTTLPHQPHLFYTFPPQPHSMEFLITPFVSYAPNSRPCCQAAMMMLNTRIAAVEAQVIEITRVLRGFPISPLYLDQMFVGLEPQLVELRERLVKVEGVVYKNDEQQETS